MFSHNQKVVPLKKSYGENLRESTIYKSALNNNQRFLYVIGYRDEYKGEKIVSCSYYPNATSGDLFLESDLISYVERDWNNIQDRDEKAFTVNEIVELLQSNVLKGEDKFLIKRI